MSFSCKQNVTFFLSPLEYSLETNSVSRTGLRLTWDMGWNNVLRLCSFSNEPELFKKFKSKVWIRSKILNLLFVSELFMLHSCKLKLIYQWFWKVKGSNAVLSFLKSAVFREPSAAFVSPPALWPTMLVECDCIPRKQLFWPQTLPFW